ncbi:Cof-type HAD-IIB family hydrolase [Paenibacillus sp. L3-i20]|uniref:Cof-type HAD-IIB family hydrolase n=1 Tax=Paenibacillus sp. L3-i20 TaxID=2905833 RepID=UPI001EDD3BF0|nr:Cof-type HAD-IIB family hydrolase [Paenibacillus sp. L3-i20]GKU80345.1 5-amino-6-(5-phospho-D-ribitylamino)uracil phosphatase YcsE [Paenibacillus sp. L3-i20]
MTKYKLVALDMDGTLLNDQSEISSENAEWIKKAIDAGVTVSFSTGRGFKSALPFAEQLKLDSPMITVNGGEIWTRPHVLHKRTELSPYYVKRLHELALQYGETWFWAYTTETIYNKERWFDAAHNYDTFNWLKFGYYTEDDLARESILAEVQSWGALEITNSSLHNIELNPQGISKASALKDLCQWMNIDMSQVVAAGDSLNDIAAIREAGLGVAMGNAQEAVKNAADVITVTNNENGIAEIIKKYVLS